MTKTRLSVDTGSVHLPAGEDHLGSAASHAPEGTDAIAVSRFRQAFDQPRHADPEWAIEEEAPLQSPFALLGEVACRAEPSEIGAELERLWVNSGVSGVREVRMKMSESLLPGTSVRIYEAAGLLQVELSVAAGATRQWLAAMLPLFTQDLGERLKRPVRATLLAASGSDEGASASWPRDGGGS